MPIDSNLGPIESADTAARVADEDRYDGVFTGEANNDPFPPLALPDIDRAHRPRHVDRGGVLAIGDILLAFAIVAPLEAVPDGLAIRCAGAFSRVPLISHASSAQLLDALRTKPSSFWRR